MCAENSEEKDRCLEVISEVREREKLRLKAAECKLFIATETERRKAAAEKKRLAAEAEAKRLAAEAEAKRLAEEAEAKRLAAEEAEAAGGMSDVVAAEIAYLKSSLAALMDGCAALNDENERLEAENSRIRNVVDVLEAISYDRTYMDLTWLLPLLPTDPKPNP